MPLTDELVAALTPEHTPSEIYDVPGYEPLRPLEDGPELRRWQWTQTLRLSGFAEYLRRFALGVDGAWYVGVGLVPWTGTEVLMEASAVLREAVHESGYIWGGLVLTSARIPPYLALNLLQLNAHLPRLPVVVRHARYQAQALEVREGGVLLGTAASWVRTTPGHDLGGGFGGCVTASHALGRGVGTYDIQDGGILRGPTSSVELSPPCLDAAFLEMALPRLGMTPYTTPRPTAVASGKIASFDGATTGPVTGTITHMSVEHPHGYSGSGIPMILCHDGLGNGGDSGALVNVDGNPTGMHLGRIRLDSGAAEESRAIFLHQIAHVMNLELIN